uniref:39S ribosomal protein L22, mitochondrial n=1 Tax=Meloidogyne hapla TaxID=6305 RepID=A0A1I8C2M1_MELHA
MRRFLPAISGYAPIQRFDKPTPKIYYAPEWRLDKSGLRNGKVEKYSPMNNYGVTPDKWEYLNKVVWPPNYVVPETGKPKAREVFHPTLLLAETIEEAVERASDEFKIENPLEGMFVAEAFAVQCKIDKSARRHARGQWHLLRHRYINIFVRLEEGEPPTFKGREPDPNGWEKMQDYYAYLRSRDFKYSI